MEVMFVEEGIWFKIRCGVSGFCLAVFTLLLMFSGDVSSLNHPNWCRFFTVLFMFFLWICISGKLYDQLESGFIKGVLSDVSAKDFWPPYNYLVLAAYILVAFGMFGIFAARVVVAAYGDGASEELTNEFMAWVTLIPVVGDLMDVAGPIDTFLGTDLAASWQMAIDVSCDIILISVLCIGISVVTKLLVGEFCGNFFWRILIGIAMLIYVVFVPFYLSLLWGILFPESPDMHWLFWAIDRGKGLWMILGYLLLSWVLALFCSTLIWAFLKILVWAFGFLILVMILGDRAGDLLTYIMDNFALIAMGLGVLYVLGSKVWSLTAFDD